jgi:HK97 family phage major capsid protein
MNLKEIELRLSDIAKESEKAEGEALDKLVEEAKGLKKQQAELRKASDEAEKRKKILDSLNAGEDVGKPIDNQEESRNMGNIDSIEYRKAFKEYVQTGVMAPEFRAAALTKDNGAVIPETVLNQIVEKMESFGNIYPLVRKLHYAAGLVVPASTLSATGTWMNEGDAVAINGKSTTKITFGAYQLGAAIGMSYQMEVKSLSAFEAAVVDNVAKAMVKAIEQAIVVGDGVAKPQGIATTTVSDTKRNVTLSSKLTYQDLVNIIKAIPSAYRTGTVLTMNEATFWDFMSITDNNGQPVGKVNFGTDAEPAYMLMGRKVITTDFLPDLTSADKVVAYAVNYDNYILNTAADADLVEYYDYPTRTHVYQSVALVDGKLVDDNGLVLIKTPASK